MSVLLQSLIIVYFLKVKVYYCKLEYIGQPTEIKFDTRNLALRYSITILQVGALIFFTYLEIIFTILDLKNKINTELIKFI